MRVFKVTQKALLLLTVVIAIVSCTKKNESTSSPKIPELLAPGGGGTPGSITPLTVTQKALITSYTLDVQSKTANVSSDDGKYNQAVFKYYYENTDSLLISITLNRRDTLYVKQTKNYIQPDSADNVMVYYQGIEYNADLDSWDDVDREIRNGAFIAILMRRDVRDYLYTHTARTVFTPNYMIDMISAGFGGTGSRAEARARGAMSHFMNFWGCSGGAVTGVDTSCEPLQSHGMCMSTVSWTADCPWYTIPFGMA